MDITVLSADYLVLGVGAAGAVMARVLSDDPTISVIAIEAGPNADHDAIIVQPTANIDANIYGPRYMWPGNTLPNADVDGRTHPWTNGRGLGGGTMINGMLYNEGSKQRFNQWTAKVGPDWDGDKVMQAYMELKHDVSKDKGADAGNRGPQAVRVGISDSTVSAHYLAALRATGAPGTENYLDNYNNPNTPIGLFKDWHYSQFADQTRASSSRSCLGPTIIDDAGHGCNGRKLLVLTETTATHLIWSETHPNTVLGVYALRNRIPVKIIANREVIISMGFNSSAFLQVNGIGPKPVLQAAKVPVRIDSPNVGTGLKNGFYVVTVLKPPTGAHGNSEVGSFNETGALLPDPRPGKPLDERNVQLSTTFRDLPAFGGLVSLFIVEAPLRARSSGTIKITGNDPLKLAEADIGFFHDPDDLAATIAVFDRIVTPAIMYLEKHYQYNLIYPSLATLQDPVQLTTFIKNIVGNGSHYQCSNHMGRQEDGAVVDSWCKVYGTTNLRVVDDSVVPRDCETDGNTAATAEMIPWRVAKHLTASA